MATDREHRISTPRIYLLRMLVFLVLIGFVALILYRQIATAFMANPGLNALIIGVMMIGIVLALRQVWRLFSEARWVNTLHRGEANAGRQPVLLAPMARLIGERGGRPISTLMLRAILDSVGSRLDEAREISRYLTGLLVFLGLLGTFWGLLETLGSIGRVIGSMQGGSDTTLMFDELKAGLSAPLAGMAISFTSSLFGLAGSLVLGFLDLQAGQAQNRFYMELEDSLSSNAMDPMFEAAASAGLPPEIAAALAKMTEGDPGASRASTTAMANLAEGIQGLVKHMRSEQQMIRDWVEAQAEQQREMRKLLERLGSESERR
ncbi:MAG: flagellar motor protein MotA [Beijerinckiaceae bacterium]|nr:flagellar motor protein MotA [Beijerinckiaceae bacterium]